MHYIKLVVLGDSQVGKFQTGKLASSRDPSAHMSLKLKQTKSEVSSCSLCYHFRPGESLVGSWPTA